MPLHLAFAAVATISKLVSSPLLIPKEHPRFIASTHPILMPQGEKTRWRKLKKNHLPFIGFYSETGKKTEATYKLNIRMALIKAKL